MGDLDLIPAKLLTTLVRADFWLWLGLLAMLWAMWRRWHRIATWILISIVACVTLVGFVPVGGLWLAPLESRFPANPDLPHAPSAIIILGGAEDTATAAAWDAISVNGAGDRFLQGLRRAQEFPTVPVLFAGGSFDPTRDALLQGGSDRVARMLRETGDLGQRVFTADTARNTTEHPADIQAFLDARGIDPTEQNPLLIITSAFHMPRAIGVFCEVDLGSMVADPTDYRSIPDRQVTHALRWNYAKNLAQLQVAFREWAALVTYQAAGHTTQLVPDGC